MTDAIPTLADIRATADAIAPHVLVTPMVAWSGPTVGRLLGGDAEVFMKLETLQRTGTFKARGAMANALAFSHKGNHAA